MEEENPQEGGTTLHSSLVGEESPFLFAQDTLLIPKVLTSSVGRRGEGGCLWGPGICSHGLPPLITRGGCEGQSEHICKQI